MASKLVTVAEVDPFPATAERVGLTENEREGITVFVAENPEAGDRKLRWGGKGKGKRGGYRAVYYYFDDANPVYLLAIYPKNQRIDLAPKQRKRLSALAAELKSSAKARRKGLVLRRMLVR